MMKNYLWTKSRARLQFVKTGSGHPLNWLFLPGGPGLGSESLSGLVRGLELPGTLWLLDLPGDGSNTTDDNVGAFAKWPEALLEAVSALDNVVFAGHSTGGMFAQAEPQLESRLLGLVLMDSAPDASWRQTHLPQMFAGEPIPELDALGSSYSQNPSDDLLKKMTVASAPYFFAPECLKQGISLFESLPYNHEICDWAGQNFDETYKAQWIPKELPTLVLSGALDRMTPLELFSKRAAYQRENIMFREIENAGHFPWIENPRAVAAAYTEYLQLFDF